MSSLERRIGKLEEKSGLKRELRVIYFMYWPPDLRAHGEDERHIELTPDGLWGIVMRGAPFTEEEIRSLKKEYQERHGNGQV